MTPPHWDLLPLESFLVETQLPHNSVRVNNSLQVHNPPLFVHCTLLLLNTYPTEKYNKYYDNLLAFANAIGYKQYILNGYTLQTIQDNDINAYQLPF